jgi:glucose-1-phosphate thymidylyltransferase
MNGLILAGGYGTRLRPLTFTGNKHMIPIANKAMLFHGLEHLINAGIKKIVIVLGPLKEGIKEAVGNGMNLGVDIKYIDQGEPKGLAHAVMISEDVLGYEPFVMYLGDNLIKQGVKPLIYAYHNESSDCVICLSRVKNPSQYGVVEVNSDGKVVKLVEKPKEPTSDLALAGVYVFNSHVYDAVRHIQPSWRNELEITDTIQYLLDRGKKVTPQYIEGWWKDTGRPDDLLEANQLVLDDLIPNLSFPDDPSCRILGRVSIGSNSKIHRNSTIRGPVIIGKNCEIGPCVYIGPYTSIGDNSRVLSGEIENSIIMNSVTINCRKRITESIIGNNSVVESADNILPSGLRFTLGESTSCRV